jgi:hypothetical protein
MAKYMIVDAISVAVMISKISLGVSSARRPPGSALGSVCQGERVIEGVGSGLACLPTAAASFVAGFAKPFFEWDCPNRHPTIGE